MYPCKYACIHPIFSWSFCLHMTVMSSSPPPRLAEQLRLLQTSSYIEPKSAFLQRPPPPLLAPVLPRGATQSKSILAPRDSPSHKKTVMESFPVPSPPPHRTPPHRTPSLSSPARTSSGSFPAHDRLAALTIYSEAVYGFPHTQSCRPHTPRPPQHPTLPLRPRRCPCPRC